MVEKSPVAGIPSSYPTADSPDVPPPFTDITASGPDEEESGRPPARRWIRVVCGERMYAVPLERVREILTPQPLTRLPGCDAEVAGLIGVRGRIVTVLDLGRILGRRPAISLPEHRLLLVDHEERIVGLAVEEASAVLDGDLRPPVPERERLAGVDPEGPEVLGFVHVEEDGIVALDLDAVIGRRIV